MVMDFSAERVSYERGQLAKQGMPTNPIKLLTQWVNDAIAEPVAEPYAITLATCGTDMRPAARTMLIREISDAGLVFYTNYDSDKAQDIAENANAQALFFWYPLERQVRISGKIAKINRERSEAYFHKRPFDSQIAAWVSEPQSGTVANRTTMQTKFDALKQHYPEGTHVPCPEFWGGYILVPDNIEFWQGRENRMHDRIRYALQQDNSWQMQRLLP